MSFDIAQDFATMSVDPCDDKVSLESVRGVDQIRTDSENIHLKTPKRRDCIAILYISESSRMPTAQPRRRKPAFVTHDNEASLCVESSRIPKYDELTVDEEGN